MHIPIYTAVFPLPSFIPPMLFALYVWRWVVVVPPIPPRDTASELGDRGLTGNELPLLRRFCNEETREEEKLYDYIYIYFVEWRLGCNMCHPPLLFPPMPSPLSPSAPLPCTSKDENTGTAAGDSFPPKLVDLVDKKGN